MNIQSLTVWPFVAAMAFVVVLSNILVQYQFEHLGLGELLTWGAFTYPFAFLVNDLTNRRFGNVVARRVVYVGFTLAVVLSIWLASPRIAIASGTAFLTAQLVDILIFDRLRHQVWWRAPLVSGIIGALVDTALFFSIAFAGSFAFLDTGFGLEDNSLAFPVSFIFGGHAPLWVQLALGDLMVKLAIGVIALVPYGALLSIVRPVETAPVYSTSSNSR